MQQHIQNLKTILQLQLERFTNIKEHPFAKKSAPDKWSKKEILGHLIDSAQNNIQRFIRGQYEDQPFIVYDQNQWVNLHNYQDYTAGQVVELWMLLNLQILNIWKNMPEEHINRSCKLAEGNMTLEELAADYIRHTQHHLTQINS